MQPASVRPTECDILTDALEWHLPFCAVRGEWQ